MQPSVSSLNGQGRDNTPAEAEAVMPYEDILGLLIGLGALMAMIGYLADVYCHPQRFRWLELPRGRKWTGWFEVRNGQ